jgi:hypothetical protein
MTKGEIKGPDWSRGRLGRLPGLSCLSIVQHVRLHLCIYTVQMAAPRPLSRVPHSTSCHFWRSAGVRLPCSTCVKFPFYARSVEKDCPSARLHHQNTGNTALRKAFLDDRTLRGAAMACTASAQPDVRLHTSVHNIASSGTTGLLVISIY